MKIASVVWLALFSLPQLAAAQHVAIPRSLRGLPPLDATIAPDFAASLTLVDTALRMRAPSVMDRTPQQDLSRKLSQTLAPWLRRRMAATQAADTALQALASRSPAHTAVAAALSATLWDSFGAEITGLRPPRAISSHPDLLATYHQLLDEQTAPFRERARSAYEACARAAAAGAWATYCTSHLSPPAPP